MRAASCRQTGMVAVLVTVGALALQAQEPPQPAPAPAPAAEESRPGKLTGLVFGDYYAFPSHHAAQFERQNGLWLRRLYLTYDRELSASWSTRWRLELNSPSLQEAQDRLRPYLKDAYLRWSHGRHSLFMGLSPTPPFELAEANWGFRHVEKLASDLHRWIETRDTGLAARGKLGRLGYHVMLGAGAGIRNEVDRDKRVYLALSHEPSQSVQLEAYGDFEKRAGERDVQTLQVFAGWRTPRARAGALYVHQRRGQGAAQADLELDLLSAWGTRRLGARAWGLLRVDRSFDPDPAGATIAYLPFDARAKSTLWLAGVEFQPIPAVHLTPNVELITYDGVQPKPSSDVGLRLTLFWTF